MVAYLPKTVLNAMNAKIFVTRNRTKVVKAITQIILNGYENIKQENVHLTI